MTHQEIIEQMQQIKWARECAAAHRMSREGGGFAGAIADAYFRADSTNKTRLVEAFRDLFDRFANNQENQP